MTTTNPQETAPDSTSPDSPPTQTTRRIVTLIVMALINAAVWIVPSDVVSLIARDRHVLLGRYSREHLTLNLFVLVVTIVGLYLELGSPRAKRRRVFQVAAVLIFGAPALLLADFMMRTAHPQHYIRDSLAYHRPGNISFSVTFTDQPRAARSYPSGKPGYGTITCNYKTDRRGYRNAQTLESCDVVVLGDSFAEGSKVDDDDPWPVRLKRKTNRSVVNLGMSGYAPAHYVASLTEYGLSLSPRIVLCMIYEGNDFRASNPEAADAEPSLSDRLKRYFKQSPIRTGLDEFLIRTLGPIGAHRPIAEDGAISWLPLEIPTGGRAGYYAFEPKQITGLCADPAEFESGKVWSSVRHALDTLAERARSIDAELVIVYAPTKAHVLMPIVRDRLPAAQVRAFVALRQERLPPADVFIQTMFDRMSTKRNLVAKWCSEAGVPFVDPTDALAEAARAGTQVYFTYDQHWTPDGHEVVASVVADALTRLESATPTDTAAELAPTPGGENAAAGAPRNDTASRPAD